MKNVKSSVTFTKTQTRYEISKEDRERIEHEATFHADSLNPNDPDAMFDISQMKRYACKDYVKGATAEHLHMKAEIERLKKDFDEVISIAQSNRNQLKERDSLLEEMAKFIELGLTGIQTAEQAEAILARYQEVKRA